jgi:hypothetical protein
MKYHLSAGNWKVIGGVGLQTRPRAGFFKLPLKNSLRGWHKTWFYYENEEPSIPSFIGRLPEFQGNWSEEPTPLEAHQLANLIDKVNLLKEKGLTGMCVGAHWLTRRVQPLKKQVRTGWEYNRLQDLTQVTQEKMAPEHLVKHLGEIFQDISTWPDDEEVCPYHIRIERDPVRHPT